MEDKFMEILDSCMELSKEELESLVAQLEGVIEEKEEEDTNNYCVNCGCEKEDYESAYCDSCWEEEQARLEEEQIEHLKGVGIKDTDDGLKVMLMSYENGIIATYEIELDITKYTDEQLCEVSANISQMVGSAYYENNGELSQAQVEEIVKGLL